MWKPENPQTSTVAVKVKVRPQNKAPKKRAISQIAFSPGEIRAFFLVCQACSTARR
jgi:hypothetical protein